MKRIVLEFLRRGIMACGLGPLVLAVLYLILQQQGKLSVDDMLGKYYPECPYGDKVSLSQMMSMRSGIAEFYDTTYDGHNLNETPVGDLAKMLTNEEDGDTPLQRKMGEISKTLSFICLGVCVVMFGVGLLYGKGLLDMFMEAVSLAVAAIPEGLATVVTVVLSIGVTNMSKRNAVIRRLTAVETLGCTQVICSDKTGTLTQNKMTVVDHLGDTQLLATAMALCSDAHLNDENQAEGEPTEAALANFAYSLGLKKQDLEAATPRVDEAPFDSGRKMMSTIHDLGGSFVQYTKGGPDVVLARCTSYIEKGEVKPMTAAKMAEIMADNKVME